MCNGLTGVLYRELSVFRKRAGRQIIASSISPLLFLIAFGWGFGRNVAIGGLPYISFLIPGLIAMSSLNQSYGIAQEINITRFYFHIFDEYLMAPVSHVEIVLGEAVYGMFKGSVSTVIVLVFAFIFGVKLVFSPIFILALALHTFLFSALGITMAMIVQDHASQAAVTTFAITPMIFLSGTFFPVDTLPAVFKVVVSLLPLSYSTKVIRASLTGGEIQGMYVLIMAAFAALFFVAALLTIRKVEV
jgi:Nod factor-specific ABC transporter NodJ protein